MEHGRPVDQESREAPLVLGGNESTERVHRRELPPPAGYSAYAPFWRRALAYVIDELIKGLAFFVVVSLAGGDPGGPVTADWYRANLAPWLMLSMGYDWLFWSQGWTPGSRLFRVRIVGPDGRPPSLASAAIRVATARISNAAFSLGYLWMLWSPRRQTWHDILSRTFVVMVAEDEPRK